MSETARTIVTAAVAVVLAGLAFATRPALPKAAVFEDQGRPFYPDFKDPTAAASLEVTDWDETAARARNFKVEFRDGKYVIPSKHNHPADAKGRLASTAAAMIGLRKDDVRSDTPKDHETYGVLDPTEAGGAISGKGARVTMRDASGKALSDLIFGKAVKEKSGVRYVRLPGQRRVYESKVDYEISAKFSDWVETDLLQISASQLKKLELDSYSIDEEAEVIKDRDEQTLVKDPAGGWKLESLAAGEELNKETVDEMTATLDELKIVDVRKKPETLAKVFRGESQGLTLPDLGDLKQRGFFISQGRLYANEGEILVHADDGVLYQIWFGEIVSDADDGKEAGKESRYFLIRTFFDEEQFPPVAEPKETKEDGTPKTDEEKKRDKEDVDYKKRERESKIEAGKKREADLKRRFADWYYVMSAESFKKLRKTRADFIKKAPEQKPVEKPGEDKPK